MYSKLSTSELAIDNDSDESTPPGSPPVFDSLNFNSNSNKSGSMPIPPEELRCPLSLQLMYDPVIISSGQTYERICIEKWFSDGHNTCPKTQQKLSHFSLTPNNCVKCLVASWCEQNGVPVPDGPPESLDFNCWRLALSQFEPINSRSFLEVDSGFNMFQCCLAILNQEEDLREKCKTVEYIRFLLKDNEAARIFMGSNGFVEALTQFLELAIHAGDASAQEGGAMALFNLAVNNNRNKELMLEAGLITLLELMISNPNSHGPATALYLNLSCLEQAKPIIGSSKAIPFLIQILQRETESRRKLDALHTLFNLSTLSSNIPFLLSGGILSCLQSLVPGDHPWTKKSIAVLINLASTQPGKQEMVSTPGLIIGLATILETGDPIEQEQAAFCLNILCQDSDKCCQMVLQECVIPSLVSISVNGTTRGRYNAHKLLMLFREKRQTEQPSAEAMPPADSRPPCKSISVSRGKMGKGLSFFWKRKGYSVCQY